MIVDVPADIGIVLESGFRRLHKIHTGLPIQRTLEADVGSWLQRFIGATAFFGDRVTGGIIASLLRASASQLHELGASSTHGMRPFVALGVGHASGYLVEQIGGGHRADEGS